MRKVFCESLLTVFPQFLDAQRITNLTIYLQELHNRGIANSDHTTLLLNCYTKLKDVAALDAFIRRPPSNTKEEARDSQALENGEDELDAEGEDGKTAEREQLPFDLETAIRVCRQGGFYTHATYLAKRYEVHDEYMRIQIEDTQSYNDALLYIRESTPDQVSSNTSRSRLIRMLTIVSPGREHATGIREDPSSSSTGSDDHPHD